MRTIRYPRFGNGISLGRVIRIAADLGIDLASFGEKGAVITGSHGKGSTAAMCAAILEQTGASVGLFTSPHLFALNERIRIDGKDISDEAFAHSWDRVEAAIKACEEGENIGAFEFLFLIAADAFRVHGCVHTIWEAGIGGHYDLVRLIEAKRTALTALDLEHTNLLGETLEEIARDKLDAAPTGASVFVGASCVPQRGAIEAHAAERGLNLVFASEAPSPLSGAHQRQNAALAIALAQDIADLTPVLVERGLAAARWPGRLEIISRAPLIIIDVAHTPGGAAAAREGFAELAKGRPATLIVGVAADKNIPAILAALAPHFGRILCVAARHRGAPAEHIAAAALAANSRAEVSTLPDVAAAVGAACSGDPTAAFFVTGSLFLAAEFKAVCEGRDPASLAFF